MGLNEVKPGEEVSVVSIPDISVREHLLRFGVSEGSRIICRARLPLGPTVFSFGRQEIALGRPIAKSILVRPVANTITPLPAKP